MHMYMCTLACMNIPQQSVGNPGHYVEVLSDWDFLNTGSYLLLYAQCKISQSHLNCRVLFNN